MSIGGGSSRPKVVCSQPTKTKQSFKAACDVNNILKRYKKNGVMTHVNRLQAMYGDFTNVPDYRSACDIVNNAQKEFNNMPSELRSYFRNDAGYFLEFCGNPANRQELERLGLVKPKANEAAKPISEPEAAPVAQSK